MSTDQPDGIPSILLYVYAHSESVGIGLPFLAVGPFAWATEALAFASRYPVLQHAERGYTVRRWGAVPLLPTSKLGETGRWVSAMPSDTSTGDPSIKWPDLPLTYKGGR